MPARHLCPHCAGERASPQAACQACHYPNHTRAFEEPQPVLPVRNPYQFHLWVLLLWVTIASFLFSVIGRHGIRGLILRADLIAEIYIFAILPLVSFYQWWKREGMEDPL